MAPRPVKLSTYARRLLLPVALTGVLAGCGISAHSPAPANTTAPAATSGAPVAVQISGYAFHPVTLTVAAGSKVMFSNGDQTAHTATSTATPAAFDTGTLMSGQSKTISFKHPGTYYYYCQFHAFMRATIVVK